MSNVLTFETEFGLWFSSSLSIITILFSLILFIFISIVNKRVNESLPYRLSIIILLGDLIFSCLQLLNSGTAIVGTNSLFKCRLANKLLIIGISITMLFALDVGLVYLLSIVYNYKPTKAFKISIYSVPFLITILLVILSSIIKDRSRKIICTDLSTYDGLYWALISEYGLVFITIILCPIFYLYIIVYLIVKRKSIPKNQIERRNMMFKIYYKPILRMSAYILIPVIGYVFSCIYLIMKTININIKLRDVPLLYLLDSWFNSIQGFFNSLLFLSNTVFIKELELALDRKFGYSQSRYYFIYFKSFHRLSNN